MTKEELKEAWAKTKPRIDFDFLTDKYPVIWVAKDTSRFIGEEGVHWFDEMDELYGKEGEG